MSKAHDRAARARGQRLRPTPPKPSTGRRVASPVGAPLRDRHEARLQELQPLEEALDLLRLPGRVRDGAGAGVVDTGLADGLPDDHVGAVGGHQVAARAGAVHDVADQVARLVEVGDVAQHAHQQHRDRAAQVDVLADEAQHPGRGRRCRRRRRGWRRAPPRRGAARRARRPRARGRRRRRSRRGRAARTIWWVFSTAGRPAPMSRNWRTPTSPARWATARPRNARDSRTTSTTSGLSASQASPAARSAAVLSVPPSQ